jgi:hypothetical protein
MQILYPAKCGFQHNGSGENREVGPRDLKEAGEVGME